MGVVYKARDTRLGRLAALKVMRPERLAEADATRRFLREAQTASALNHPNILTIYEIDTDADLDYIAMEFVAGGTLADLIASGPLPAERALRLAAQVADALAAAHAASIVHRDLKPSNIMMAAADRVKVVDFGLAKLAGAAASADETVDAAHRRRRDRGNGAVHVARAGRGASPSTRAATCSAWARSSTRCWRAGCPFAASPASARSQPSSGTRRRRSRASAPDVARLVDRCLRKDPAERFQSAAELKAAIEACLAPQPAAGRPSVAVLPFASMSGAKEDDYLCEGLAEEIINALTRIPGLRVIARTSAFAVGRLGLDVREAGARLGVEHHPRGERAAGGLAGCA